METKGIELPANSASKGQLDETAAQNTAHTRHDDPALAMVIRAWPGLPADVKRQIKDLIEASGQ